MKEWSSWLMAMSWLAPLLLRGGGGPRAVGPAVAGTWYPAEASTLASTVDGLLAHDDVNGDRGRVLALVAPHAGYVYSGAVAGRGFRAVRGQPYRRVLLIGPSHYEGFHGAAVPEAEVYRTPLGDVELDHEAIESLRSHAVITVSDRPFRPEHSLEAELPFLQRALPAGWRLVPVLTGPGSTGAVAGAIAEALEPLRDDATLVVVSSDFTHFGSGFGYVPFTRDVPGRIRDLDMGAVKLVEARDVDGFEDYVRRTGVTICGRDAIDVLLRMLPRDVSGQMAAYDTSGRQTGDWSHSVSYAAVAFRQPAAAGR